MKMLHTQLQPYYLSGASWSPGITVNHGCQFCVAARLPSEAPYSCRTYGKLGNFLSRDSLVLYQFGSRLHEQGQRLRFPEKLWSSRPMAGREGAAQPVVSESDNSSVDLSQDNSHDGHVGTTFGPQYKETIAYPSILPRRMRLVPLSVVDQAFLFLGLIAFTTSFALFALIVTAIPALHAMRKAALSVEKLADIAREELPATMAAVRLSGMEISDLTLELNDLSQEISDGVRNSSRAVQAAEVGLRRIGSVAASQTFARLQETASVPVQVVRPAVVSAAATTLHAVSQAQKLVLSLASSSYPRISDWLGQRGNAEKQGRQVEGVSPAAATLTELLTGQETSAAAPLSGGPSLLLVDADDDEGNSSTKF